MDNYQNRKFTCKIYYFLHSYFKIAFYLCMIPFTSSLDKNGKLKIEQYRLHQVLCFVLHLSSLYFGLTTLWDFTKETGISSGPSSSTVHRFALFTLLNSSVVVFIFNCWLASPNPYKSLLIHTLDHVDKDDSHRKNQKISMLIVLLMTFVQVGFTATPEITDLLNSKDILNHSNLHFATYLLTTFQAVYFQIMFQITTIITFDLSNFCMYLIGQKFKELASIEYAALGSQNTKRYSQSLERLTDYFLSVKSLTKALNKAFSASMISIFLSCLPTLGYGLSLMVLSNSSVPIIEHVRTIYILIACYLFLLMAAKGQSNVQKFPLSAFELMWKNGSLKVKGDEPDDRTRNLLLTIMQYMNSSCIGVGGTPFFIVTYRFVGTMTSALITYTIIMLQLR